MPDAVFMIMFGILALAAAAIIGPKLAKLTRSDDPESMLRDFMGDAMRRGLSPREASAQLAMREALVRIRRDLSAAVLSRGAGAYFDERDRLVKEEARTIVSLYGVQHSTTFFRWMGGLTYHALLDHRATSAMDRWKRAAAAPISDDMAQALRLRR